MEYHHIKEEEKHGENKKFLIDVNTGKTYEAGRIEKLNATKDKNNTKSIPKPSMRGENNPMKKEENRKKSSDTLKMLFAKGILIPHMKGKTHSVEMKELMSQLKRGQNHPCYNTIFVNDGIINKRIKKDIEIPEGFSVGRIITESHKENAKVNSNFSKPFMSIIETKKSYNKGNAYKLFIELF